MINHLLTNIGGGLMRSVVVIAISLLLSACLEGSSGIVINTPEDSSFSISGTISSAAGIFVDSDTNDTFAIFTSNNTPQSAQQIPNILSLQGFASLVGSGRVEEKARFFTQGDISDYYSVSLSAGQVIQLQVIDANTDNDLDLYLLNADSSTVQTSNQRGLAGQTESITVSAAGDYLIHVSAYGGASKYILQITPPTNITSVTPSFVPGEMVVQYRPNIGIARIAAVAPTPILESIHSGMQRRASVDPLQAFNSDLYELQNTLMEIKRKNDQSDVEFAEPNFIRQSTAIPNDASYALQWHYPAINLPQAWDITKGNSTSNVIVAVIDTGVFLQHTDLTSRLVQGYDFIKDIDNAGDGNGIDNNPDDPGDGDSIGLSSWHGTHVAGTIAAHSNNNIGVAGISWGAKIMPIRVLGKKGGTSYDVSQGIRYAAGLSNDSQSVPTQRADIINLSLGSTGSTITEQNAIKDAIDAGVLVVAAAGNDNSPQNFYPAAYPDVIAVSATRMDGTKASYSNYGSYISLAAPGGELSEDRNSDGNGDGILSTFVAASGGTRTSAYAWLQGTSMAAPHVAGVLALMKALKPELTQHEVLDDITTCRITQKTTCGHDQNLGYGVIDAYAAVQEVLDESQSIPAILALNETQIAFSNTMPRVLTLANKGQVEATNIQVSSSVSWLNAVPTQVALASGAQTTLTVTPNSPPTRAGTYRALLTITYESNIETKAISLQASYVIGPSVTGQMTLQYVLLEDMNCTDENCIIETTNPLSNGAYSFSDVPKGSYRVHAGSDIDANGYICEVAETCGRYPSAGSTLTLESNITGANVQVGLVSGANASGALMAPLSVESGSVSKLPAALQ